MDVAYVEMVEDLTPAMASTAEVRRGLDAVLADMMPPTKIKPVDREAWLRGQDAAEGQAAMLDFASARRRR